MPYTYRSKFRANCLQKLVHNLGNIRRTAEETGVSERTLQDWKREINVRSHLVEREPTSEIERLTRENYQQIRQDLIEHINRISAQFRADPANAADLAIALSRLIDRLHKLESILEPHHFSLIILFEYPDGSLNEEPFLYPKPDPDEPLG